MISTAELILLRLYPFLTLWLKMESGFCHFSFPSDCGSLGTLQGFALWTLGLCLLAKAFVLGAVWSLPGVSRLLTRIGLTDLHQPQSQGSAAVLFLIGVPTEEAGQRLATLPLLPKQAREPDPTADPAWVFGQEIPPRPSADVAP